MATFNDVSPIQAQNFLISQRTHIESEVYKTRYPEITYDTIIPVDTSAPEWAPTVAVQSVDYRGELAFIGPNSNDLNTADVGYGLGQHQIQTAQLGYRYSLEEIGQAMLMDTTLSAERALGAQRMAEQGLNKLAYLGNASAGYEGLLNNSSVNVTGVGGTIASLVAAATDIAGVQAIVTFFQAALEKVYVQNTNTTFMPTHIILPVTQYQLLASAIVPFGGSMTILNYLKANLVVGRAVGIEILPELSLKGAGAGSVDRMVVYTRDMQVAKFHLPMGFRFLDVHHESPLSWFVPGIVRTGGTEVRVPKAMEYFDGV